MRDALVAMLRKLATDIQNGDVAIENVAIETDHMHDDSTNTVTAITITEERP